MSGQRISQLKALLGIMHGSRTFGGPVQASLSLTNRCNIKCIHCYYHSPIMEKPAFRTLRRARMAGEELPDIEKLRRLQRLDFDVGRARRLVDELLGMGTRRFMLTGSGEMFLHPEALELSARLKHAGCSCLAETNGTLLKRDTADELIRIGFDELRITTMAGGPDSYVRTHPGSTEKMFHTVRENLKYISERKKALGVNRPRVTLIVIVVRQNHDRLLEFARFAEDAGADNVLFRPVDDISDECLADVVPTEEQAEYIMDHLPEVKAHLESCGIPNNIDYFLMAFRRQLDTSGLYQTIPCYYGWLASLIDTHGEVMPCCRCYDSVGNVTEAGFGDIWNGEAYRAFRRNSIGINKRGGVTLKGCDCNSCIHYIANMRVFRILHPLKGRSALMSRLAPEFTAINGGAGAD